MFDRKKLFQLILVVFFVWFLLGFAFSHKPSSHKTSKEHEFAQEYNVKLGDYASFHFDEKTRTYTMRIIDQETIEEFSDLIHYRLSNDTYGWPVLRENLVKLSELSKQEVGESRDIQLINPYNEKQILLLIHDEEIVYDFTTKTKNRLGELDDFE